MESQEFRGCDMCGAVWCIEIDSGGESKKIRFVGDSYIGRDGVTVLYAIHHIDSGVTRLGDVV